MRMSIPWQVQEVGVPSRTSNGVHLPRDVIKRPW